MNHMNFTNFGSRFVFVLSVFLFLISLSSSMAAPPSSVPPESPPGKPTQDVNVTNDESNPVPVTVENESIDVNLEEITDPIPTTVENTDPISTVIENGASDPVPTFDVDRQVIDPLQRRVDFDIPDGSQTGEADIYTVPNGMRLVIEYVTVITTLPNPSVLRSVGVRIPDSFGNGNIHRLPFPEGVEDEFNDETSYSFGAPTKFYAAPGRTVSIVVNRPRLSNGAIGGEGSATATISGHLVPCGGDLGPCE